MASPSYNKILLRRSLTPSSTPTGLTTGEIAVNIADQLIFVGSTNGNYITFNSVGPTGPQGFQGTTGPQGFIDEPTNAYGLTSYEHPTEKNTYIHDRLSLIYARGTSSADPGAGPSSDFTSGSIDNYYYSNDIQYDPWNKITTLIRFNEKIYNNGGPTSATSGGPWTIDLNNGTLQYINLSNAATGTTKYFEFVPSITNPQEYNSSISFLLMVVGGGNPALTIQWPSGMKWENDLGAPTLGSTQQLTIIPFTYLMGTGLVTGVTGWYGGADLKYSLTGS